MSSAETSTTKFPALSVAAARRIDEACDRWEVAWLAGNPDPLQHYLASFEEALRPALLRQLLLLEWDYRQQRGERVEVSEYLDRFPEYARVINAANAEHLLDTQATEQSVFTTDPQDLVRVAQAAKEWAELGYVILKQLGWGMGTVFLARHTATDRLVALKVLRGTEAFDPGNLERFRREVQTLARLQHPHIVPVYDVGEYQGRPFYSMEYCSGGSLADYLRQARLTAEESARLVETLAHAVHAAHQAQIIHRDLKPSNVLLQKAIPVHHAAPESAITLTDFTPKLGDFGLAKALDGDAQTQTGLVVGTPQYMAPEQARGDSKVVGVAADTYSLGAILYECLAGRPPFRGANLWDTLQQVNAAEPPPLKHLYPHVPRDLETICFKCLRKEPQERYANAASLAEDLRRFCDGEPILVRPVGSAERAWKWSKRHPAVAGLLGVLFVSAIFVSWLASWGNGERLAAIAARNTAADATKRAESEQGRAHRNAAISMYTQALLVGEQGDAASAQLWLASGLKEAVRAGAEDVEKSIRNQLGAVQQHLRPLHRIVKHGSQVFAVAISPDGAQFATAGDGQEVRIWDTTTGLQTGPPLPHQGTVYALDFSFNGKLLVTGSGGAPSGLYGGTAQVWDLATAKKLGPPMTDKNRILSVAFSPDGSTVLTGSHDGTAHLWDWNSGQPKGLPLEHRAIVRSVAFSPNGEMIATGGDDATARLWNTATGKPVGKPMACKERVFAVAFSPDGNVLLTGSRDAGQLWRIPKCQPLGLPLQHEDWVMAVDFSPDGKTLVTASVDHNVCLWEASTSRRIGRPILHPHQVRAVKFHPDGQSILTGCFDNFVRILGFELPQQWAANVSLHAAALSPDGSMVVAGGWDGSAQLWNIATREKVELSPKHPDAVLCVAFSPDGSSVVTGCGDGLARLWNVSTGQLIGPPVKNRGAVRGVAFSPDGEKFVTGDHIWDTATREQIGPPLEHKNLITAVAFSRDGKTILTGGWDHFAKRWNATTGEQMGSVQHTYAVSSLACDPTQDRYATGTWDKSVRIWDLASDTPIGTPLAHSSPVKTVAFSPDGQTVLTGCFDGTAWLWEMASGKRLGLSLEHHESIESVAFFPDGKAFFTACQDGTLRVCKLFPPTPGEPAQILRWTEVVTGMEIDKFGSIRTLDAESWNDRRDQLRASDAKLSNWKLGGD